MGLFDRFRKNKKEPQKQEKTISVGNNLKNDGKTNHVQNTKSPNVKFNKNNEKPSRQELEKQVAELRKKTNKIDLGFGEELNEMVRKDLNQELDDTIIRNYGTDEEKAQMKLRKKQDKIKKEEALKLNNKYDEAKKLSEELEYEKAIKLFKEVTNELTDNNSMTPLIYLDYSECYYKLGDYDNAIEVLKKGLRKTNKNDSLYSMLKDQIETYKTIESKEKTRDLINSAMSLYNVGEYDKAIPIFQKCVDLKDNENYTYIVFSDIYHRRREFEMECQVLEEGMKNIKFASLTNENKTGVGDRLENVKYYMKNGKFKWDCLPIDNTTIPPKIRKAKSVLKENEERGVELLEDILEEGTFNNTVYYTLYKTYLKNGRYDAAISISDEAIDKLGFYSQDRLEKWTKYKDKATAKKDK